MSIKCAPAIWAASRTRRSSRGRSSRASAVRHMAAVISIKGVTKSYATGFQALKSVDLDIEKGEIFALLGPNGAGKTTLINLGCCLVTTTSGNVTADGHEIVRDYRAANSIIGMVA